MEAITQWVRRGIPERIGHIGTLTIGETMSNGLTKITFTTGRRHPRKRRPFDKDRKIRQDKRTT